MCPFVDIEQITDASIDEYVECPVDSKLLNAKFQVSCNTTFIFFVKWCPLNIKHPLLKIVWLWIVYNFSIS